MIVVTPKILFITSIVVAILFYVGSNYFISNKFIRLLLTLVGFALPYSFLLIAFFTVEHMPNGVETRGESYNERQRREKMERHNNKDNLIQETKNRNKDD